MVNFNSHAHVERDNYSMTEKGTDTNFNSHAHVERDFVKAIADIILIDFNSHAHVERDVQRFCNWYELPRFQLTRSRGA